MSVFAQKFSTATNQKYDFLRLSSVEFNTLAHVAEYCFIYPESQKSIVEQDKTQIQEICKKILHSTIFETIIVFKASHFDQTVFMPQLIDMFKPYPGIASCIDTDNITISRAKDNNDTIYIDIKLEQAAHSYAQSKGITKQIKDKLYNMYTDIFEITFTPYQISRQEQEQRELARNQDTTSKTERSDGRQIVVTDIEPIFGDSAYTSAQYIADISTLPKNGITICGTLQQWDTLTSKSGKTYVRFELVDFTGSISGVLFPNSKTQDYIGKITAGNQIITKGKTESNDFNGKTTMQYKPDSIAFCKLPTDFVINKKRRPIPQVYTTVFPKPYQDTVQQSIDMLDLVSISQQSTPTQDIVVFDLETTGLDPATSKIIEIGAAKIVYGRIVETFQTLVDPLVPIPIETTAINHITDDMVKGQPQIEAVLMDFSKFCQGAILVAHNIEFDYSFLQAQGQKYDIYFDNLRKDTLAMARQHYPRLKNHKLETLCNHLNIQNQSAHRALSDVIATARLYLTMEDIGK